MGEKTPKPDQAGAQHAADALPDSPSKTGLHEKVRRTEGIDNQIALLSPLSRRKRSTKKKLKQTRFLSDKERKQVILQTGFALGAAYTDFATAVVKVQDELKKAADVNETILGFIADMTLGRLIPGLAKRLKSTGSITTLIPEGNLKAAMRGMQLHASGELENVLNGGKVFFKSQAPAANVKKMTAAAYIDSLKGTMKKALAVVAGSLPSRSDQALVSVFAAYIGLSEKDFSGPLRKKAQEFKKFVKPIGQSDGSSGRHGARRYLARVGGTTRVAQVSRSSSISYGARETNVKYSFVRWTPVDWQDAAIEQANARGVFIEEPLSHTWIKGYKPPKGGRYGRFKPDKRGKKSEVPMVDKPNSDGD